jgi:phosphomannomutase
LDRENEGLTRFLFDVDGTLTDSRQRIDDDFEEFMVDFCSVNLVAFVTGSDKSKTADQLGERLFRLADYSFNCAGNEVWHNGDLILKNEWEPPTSLFLLLEELLSETKFRRKSTYSKHIERRNGMINFSIPGLGLTLEERKDYVAWDKSVSERTRFRDRIIHKFPDIDVLIGGETGLDIYPMGKSKEQVVDFLKEVEDEKTYYFGDQIFPGGNDYKIAARCDHSYQVKSWRDTYETLAFLKETAYCE